MSTTKSERPEFVRLSDAEGRPVFLNIAEIASIASWLDGAVVRTRDGTSFEVRENPDRIIDLVLGPEAAPDDGGEPVAPPKPAA